MRISVLVAVVVTAVAVAAGAASRSPAPSAGAPVALAAPSPRASAPDWRSVLAELDAMRTDAYADPAAADPLAWVDERCACLTEERAALARLVADGHAVDAVPPRILDLSVVMRAGAAHITFVDELAAYDVVDGRQRVVRRWPGRGRTTWRGVLVLDRGAWRWRELRRGDDHDPARGVDRTTSG